MSEITIVAPSVDGFAAETSALALEAAAIVVHDGESHVDAQRRLANVIAARKRIEAAFEPAKKAAHAAHKTIYDLEKRATMPCVEFQSIVGAKILTYEEAQRRLAEEERRKLQELARQDAEARKIAEALEAEASGDKAEAAAILDEPVVAPVVVVAPAIERVVGVQARTTWKADVTDVAALISFVAANPAWSHLIEVNTAALNAAARAQRDRLSIPGVCVREVKTITGGRT